MSDDICRDLVVLNQWHPISSINDLRLNESKETVLLGETLFFERLNFDGFKVWKKNDTKKKIFTNS
jgi:hypothetical protein